MGFNRSSTGELGTYSPGVGGKRSTMDISKLFHANSPEIMANLPPRERGTEGVARERGESRPPQRRQTTRQTRTTTGRQPYVVSQTSKGTGISASVTRALLARQTREAAAKKAKLDALTKKQREKQAALMEKARGEIGKQGKGARQDIEASGIRRQALGTQNMVSRGIQNTTIADSVRRGVNSQTDRAMTQQGDTEAGRMSETFEREAGMQIGTGELAFNGINSQTGGLQDIIAMLQSVGGGI